MYNLVEKENRRRRELEALAKESSLAMSHASSMRSMQDRNSRLTVENGRLRRSLDELQRVLSDKYAERIREDASRGLTRLLIEKFKESAKELFSLYAVEDMGRIAELCLDKMTGSMSFEVSACFDAILEAADIAFEADSYGPMDTDVVASETKYTVVMVWDPRHQFGVPVELTERRTDGIKKLKEAHQNQSS